LLVEIQPFVVITSKDIILLDTGLGFQKNGKLQIISNLAEAEISPTDITKVLLSHLHKDHVGGVTSDVSHSTFSFQNATYYVHERELNFAFEKGFPSYITEELGALKKSRQVELLNEDEGLIDGYIQYKVTGAHSPHHQVFWIQEGEETIFFGGDDAPQLQQMKHRFVAKYDFNGRKAMELRTEWQELGQKEKWTFLFYHDIKTPTYKNEG
jgi:glyoxylase-like metal-dependent hydrolase (beta-lactamase superfamily II)